MVTDIAALLPQIISKHHGVKQLIILHVGAVDTRKGESEVLKQDVSKLLEQLDKLKIQSFVSGPLPNIDRRINKFSRLLALNTWLSKACEIRGVHFIDNLNLFWQRGDLFKGKGPYLSRSGVRRLTDNLLHSLRHHTGSGWPSEQPKAPLREERSEVNTHTTPATDPSSAKDPPSTTPSMVPPPLPWAPPSCIRILCRLITDHPIPGFTNGISKSFGNLGEIKNQRESVISHLESLSLKFKNQVRNLGVIMDSDLNFNSHIKSITSSAFYHLKNIARIKGSMSKPDLERLIHAFISSRLDYCNGLFTGLSKRAVRQLQYIQNADVQVLTRTRKYNHITPVLRYLHWLPVSQRIDFKTALLVYKYKSLHGSAPRYISDMLMSYEPSRTLRPSGTGLLLVHRVNTKQGEAAFQLYAAKTWNSLLMMLDKPHLWQCLSPS
uniref:Uncharacterized protein n=1 Tax=Mastacembelus armatus TaxID=205130 RepID=A0A3Q3NKS8_9TELE